MYYKYTYIRLYCALQVAEKVEFMYVYEDDCLLGYCTM
jgi:hypothetical protein